MKYNLEQPIAVETTFLFVDDRTSFMNPEMDREVLVPAELAKNLARRNVETPSALLRGAREMVEERGLGAAVAGKVANSKICIGPMYLAKDLSGALVAVGQGGSVCGTSVVVYLVPSGDTWIVQGFSAPAIY